MKKQKQPTRPKGAEERCQTCGSDFATHWHHEGESAYHPFVRERTPVHCKQCDGNGDWDGESPRCEECGGNRPPTDAEAGFALGFAAGRLRPPSSSPAQTTDEKKGKEKRVVYEIARRALEAK